MSPSIFTRRRSARFAQLIEEAGVSRRHHARSHARSGMDAELAEFVSVSRRVRDLPLTVEAHPEFREGLRAMLLATIDREGIGVTAVRPEPEPSGELIPGLFGSRRTRTRTAVIAGVAAGTLALSGMSTASGNAIPGSALYGVKRSTERAQLALAGSDTGRAELKFQFARTRLDEAAAFRDDPVRLATVFDDMDHETGQGARLMTTAAVEHRDGVSLDLVDSFAGGQREALTRLRDGLTAPGQARLDTSLMLLTAVQRRSADLRPLLPCGSAAATAVDALGPVPTARCKTDGQGANPPARTHRAPAAERNTDGATTEGGRSDTRTGPADGGVPGKPQGQPGGSSGAGTDAGTGKAVTVPTSPPAAAGALGGTPVLPTTGPTPAAVTAGGGLLHGIDGLDEILKSLGFSGVDGIRGASGAASLKSPRFGSTAVPGIDPS